MAVLNSISELVEAEINGNMREYSWRKTPTQATTVGLWFDLTLSPGTPPPKYYFDGPPLVAKAMYQSTDGGFYHGPNVAPATKFLRKTVNMIFTGTALPMPMKLMDYLLYYPSIDDGTTDEQILDNTVTLPRYTDGKGVQVMAVSVAGRTGGSRFRFSYTNSKGETGRISQWITQNSSPNIGVLLNNGAILNNNSAIPFCGLQDGDDGVRSIQSVTMETADVGLFALVLVKPLATQLLLQSGSPVEIDYFTQKGELPIIQDDAFICSICQPLGNLQSVSIYGDLKCVWS